MRVMTNVYLLDHGEGSVLVVEARHRIAVRVRVFQRVKVTLRTQSILVEPAKRQGQLHDQSLADKSTHMYTVKCLLYHTQ